MVVKVIQLTSYFCFRYGGSLPNVNQMSGGGSLDVQNSVQGLGALPPVSVPCEDGAFGGGSSPGYPIHPASISPGGGAMRTRISGERRWENSPYGSDRNYYSSSLVSTYLSPPPESRGRRTHSDSALYQKLAAAQQAGGSEQGSPVQESRQADSDIKPSQELLNSLLLREGDFLPDSKVKEEPGSPRGVNGNLENYSPPHSLSDPPAATIPPSLGHHLNLLPQLPPRAAVCVGAGVLPVPTRPSSRWAALPGPRS